jgi:hypothetical protein
MRSVRGCPHSGRFGYFDRRTPFFGHDSADLLKRRLQTLGVNAAGVDPAVMRDLQLLCARCSSKQRCAHELEDKPVAASWPKYCPNEVTIEAIKNPPLN